jgi:hypothetical protein
VEALSVDLATREATLSIFHAQLLRAQLEKHEQNLRVRHGERRHLNERRELGESLE